MSSTSVCRDAAASLFDEVLVPLAERLRAEGHDPFPAGPDPSLESYYVPRPRRAMRREDFEAPCCTSPEDFERALAAYWSAQGREALVAEVARFAAVARAAAAPDDGDAEVSPFVYVMF